MNRTRLGVPPVAGALLVLGAVGFIAVFSVLAVTFGYPDVLNQPASEVLPALVAGGPRLRIVWTVYAILPVTLAAAVLLAHDALPFTARLKRMVTLSGALASAAMIAGLARWPSAQWKIGQHWVATHDPAVRAALESVFDALNVALGNVVGEFVGEVGFAGWLAGVGIASRSTWSGRAALVLTALMLVGAFRNVIPATQAATDVTNIVLPLVLIALGVTWARGLHADRAITTSHTATGTGQGSGPSTS